MKQIKSLLLFLIGAALSFTTMADSLQNVRTVTAPTELLVSLEVVKAHLELESDFVGDDVQVESYIQSAQSYCGNYMGVQLVSAAFQGTLEQFPTDRKILFPKPPLTEVTAITYFPADGSAAVTIDAADYIVITDTFPGLLLLKDSFILPELYDRPDAIKVTFTAGYAAAQVDAQIKEAVKKVSFELYEHRDNTVKEKRNIVESFLSHYQGINLGS